MKYFTMNEFECHCGCRMPDSARVNIVALVEEVLDPAREILGRPIVVNSGYRCERHNRDVGGVRNSQHLRGEAADIAPAGLPLTADGLQELTQILVEQNRFDQLIVYPRFLHVSYKRNGGNRHQVLVKG